MYLKKISLHIVLLSAGKVIKSAFGGEDLFTRNLGRWLVNTHHQVTLIGIEFAGIRSRYLSKETIKNRVTSNVNKDTRSVKKISPRYLSYSLRTITWVFQVAKILLINAKHPIDIIHAQDSGYTGLSAIVASKILNIPAIITLHGIRVNHIESDPDINQILKKVSLKIEHRLDVFTLGNANFITLVSSTINNYAKVIAPQSNVLIVPVAVNKDNFTFSKAKRELLRRELGIPHKSLVIGFVGRLSYEKNLFTLLHSFADAVKSEPSLKLMVVGDGPLEYEMRKVTQNRRVKDKVLFCGFRNDIDKVLCGIDIFVLPSYIEGTSNALIQAMMCSRPIICSNISGTTEIVTNDKEALMFNPEDRNGLTGSILLLSSDEKLRSQLGHNARIRAAQYDEDLVFPRFVRIYQDLCKSCE